MEFDNIVKNCQLHIWKKILNDLMIDRLKLEFVKSRFFLYAEMTGTLCKMYCDAKNAIILLL